jgi:hypothetical protein
MREDMGKTKWDKLITIIDKSYTFYFIFILKLSYPMYC